MKTLLLTWHLVTFVCTDSTLTNCKVYTTKPMLDNECEAASLEVLRRARTLELKETVITYCTEDIEDLPIKPSIEPTSSSPAKKVSRYEF